MSKRKSKRKLYKIYKTFIKDNETILESQLRLRRDRVNFLYTVVNLDPKIVNDYYTEGDRIAKPVINDYVSKVSKFFKDRNMSEFIALRKVSRIDDFNWKVEFGFSLFNSRKRANWTVISLITLFSLILVYYLFF